MNQSPEKITHMPPTKENVDDLPGEDEMQTGNAEQEEGKRRSTLSKQLVSILTSFLEIDRSFFSPWNWNPNSVGASAPTAEPKPRTVFEEGSFISFDIYEFMQYATETRDLHFKQTT